VIKKVLFVVLGFGMITAGIAGITTSLVDRKNQAALQQLVELQDEAKTAAAEEQRKLEEKQQEIDRLAMKIEADRLRLQEDRRRLERRERSKMAASEKHKNTAATEPKTGTHKDYAKGKADGVGRKGVLSSHPSPTTQASRRTVPEEDFRRISQIAGLEAARSFVPVKYYNRSTRELVLAEPFNQGPGSVVVRIRVWKGERLAQDTMINFPRASLGNLRGTRPYL
jgi:hypothetical protein